MSQGQPQGDVDTARAPNGDLKGNLAAAATLILVSTIYVTEALRLPTSGVSTSDTGPRLYTLTIGIPLLALSVIFALHAGRKALARRREGQQQDGRLPGTDGAPEQGDAVPVWKRPHVTIAAATLLCIAAMDVTGFFVAATVFLFIAAMIVRGGSLTRRAAVATACFSLATTLVLVVGLEAGLGVRLPDGIMGW